MRRLRYAILAFLFAVVLATPAAAGIFFGREIHAHDIPIPEHASMVLLGAGLIVLGRFVRHLPS